ncbi:MAG: 30S ribosomal protein S1 [Bryobacteraceae bacterium]|nr:30S ribosomal protein S1 [Bryobacteraceae bacterium]MDW8377406.1 30S ribosomal protein S1 [Bryobacterales bacterium]
MSLANPTDPSPQEQAQATESTFGDILLQFEHEHSNEGQGETLQGTVIKVSQEQILVDIGRKMEGVIDRSRLPELTAASEIKPGDLLPVVITGRNEEGYYELSMLRAKRVFDWSQLEKAFEEKTPVAGRVVEVVKGGLRVDVGVRAFLPASRSGARDPMEMESLVGQEIRCLITKLDTATEDVVVDRRSLLEEEAALAKERAFASIREGAVLHGTVRTVTEYGAFVDLGGIDGLLHVADMSWNRAAKPGDLVSVGDSVEVKVLKVDPESKRISLGMKQLTPDPWTVTTQNLKVGDRVRGKVVRLADFGAFVEISPGVDGLVHLSSLAWGRRIKKPSEVVQVGDAVEVVVLDIKPAEKRISLGLKEALGDPWEEADKRFPVGSLVEDVPITNIAKFGAFVDLGGGLEGLIHIADITRERRLEHPKEVLSPGQKVRALVLEVDKQKRRIRLGMKQLEPTVLDEFLASHQVGETISGRVVSVDAVMAKVELAEGVTGVYRFPKNEPAAAPPPSQTGKADVASLTAMLAARWKQGAPEPKQEGPPKLRPGEVRTFRITKLDPARKTIDLALEA